MENEEFKEQILDSLKNKKDPRDYIQVYCGGDNINSNFHIEIGQSFENYNNINSR